MISNYVVGPEKLVLFVDHTSLEPICDKILDGLISDKVSIYRLPQIPDSFPQPTVTQLDVTQALNKLNPKANIIFPPLATLGQHYKLAALIKAIHQIKINSKTKQAFMWATVKNISDPKVIPFVEHLADIIVTLRDKETLTILTKKSSGSVTKKIYQFELDKNYQINVREIKGRVDDKPPPEPSIDPENLATFKINFDEDELVARNALKLPYERANETNEPPGPKIIYHPDSDDDFDEEDPDEDLYI